MVRHSVRQPPSFMLKLGITKTSQFCDLLMMLDLGEVYPECSCGVHYPVSQSVGKAQESAFSLSSLIESHTF